MIGLITCAEHFYNGTSREPDDQRLLSALYAHELASRVVVWDDPGVSWDEFSLCIIRSAWDYHHNRNAFLIWAEHVASATILYNPLPVILWNTHKFYLRKLEARGVPVVPTEWFVPGERVCLSKRVQQRGWSRFVIKPTVATNSFGARIFTCETLVEAQSHLDLLLGRREVMLQPFLHSTGDYGERSLVFIEGELTHAFRKRPAFEQQNDNLGEIAVTPTNEEAALARRILSHAAEITGNIGISAFLFARVDLVRDEHGLCRLMELELVEPRLRLDIAPWALDRLARAIRSRQLSSANSARNKHHLFA